MDATTMNAASDMNNQAAPAQAQVNTDPQHQYVTTPQYLQQPYNQQMNDLTSKTVAAGVMGLIVVSTGTMGANLHRVQEGDMTMTEAVNNSLAQGAKGGICAASGTAAAATLSSGGLTGLAVTLAAATGVAYLLNK